jgi:hypothetical protein
MNNKSPNKILPAYKRGKTEHVGKLNLTPVVTSLSTEDVKMKEVNDVPVLIGPEEGILRNASTNYSQLEVSMDGNPIGVLKTPHNDRFLEIDATDPSTWKILTVTNRQSPNYGKPYVSAPREPDHPEFQENKTIFIGWANYEASLKASIKIHQKLNLLSQGMEDMVTRIENLNKKIDTVLNCQ